MLEIMDPLGTIDGSVEKVMSKIEKYGETFDSSLDIVNNQTNRLDTELLSDGDDLSVTGVMLWEQCVTKVRNTLQTLGSEHRALHSGVSKCGKEIDRSFTSDFSDLTRHAQNYEKEEESTRIINGLIAEHFLANGHLDLAQSLAVESGISVNEKMKNNYMHLHTLLDALKQKNIEPAMQWVSQNEARLRERHSLLHFQLYKLKFLETVKQGMSGQKEALIMLQHMRKLGDQHFKELEVLAGCLLFVAEGVDNSPYGYLFDDSHWEDVSKLLVKDACAIMQIPVNSPLSVLLNAGTVALPTLLSLRNAMQQRQVIGVWGAEELPIEIDVGSDKHFHSVFACPILRQQTSESNPPVRLMCGHVISRDALNRLASNNSRLKCPYCPTESLVTDAIRVYF